MLLPYRPFATRWDTPRLLPKGGEGAGCGAQLAPGGSDGPIPLVTRPACIEPRGSADKWQRYLTRSCRTEALMV